MSKPSDTPPRTKKAAQKRGRWAEALCAAYLRLSGHRVLARNFKTKVGEIDVIAKRKNTLSFIEVKARNEHAQGLEAITLKQQQRIQRTAELFLIQNPMLQVCDIRFDVCTVTGPFSLKLLRDAWRP